MALKKLSDEHIQLKKDFETLETLRKHFKRSAKENPEPKTVSAYAQIVTAQAAILTAIDTRHSTPHSHR